jgi:hypothetical protein
MAHGTCIGTVVFQWIFGFINTDQVVVGKLAGVIDASNFSYICVDVRWATSALSS